MQFVICPSLALLAKDTVQLKLWGNLAKPGYNDKTPPFNSGLWLKTVVLGPPKLPSGLELCSMALGQFWRPSDSSFSRVPRKKVEFWPKSWFDNNGQTLTIIVRSPIAVASSKKSSFLCTISCSHRGLHSGRGLPRAVHIMCNKKRNRIGRIIAQEQEFAKCRIGQKPMIPFIRQFLNTLGQKVTSFGDPISWGSAILNREHP